MTENQQAPDLEKERDESIPYEGPVWNIPREGKTVRVTDEELTEEETAMLRASELINEMALAPVLEDIEEMKAHLKFAEEELVKRHERIRHLTETDNKTFSIIAKLAKDYFAGALPADTLTKNQFDELELIYVRTLPYVTLEPDDEVKMRDMIRRVADGEFDKGEFNSKEAAREFFGLGVDIEEEIGDD